MDAINCQPLLDGLSFALVQSGAVRDLAKRKTELEKIKLCLGVEIPSEDDKINVRKQIQNLLEALYVTCEDHGKSEDLAMKAKTRGSQAYLKKKDNEALVCFSESIGLAPAESSVLPLAFANRSAVLYQMHRYKEALQDMEWAENTCYPATLKHKLLIRRCRCYLMMGDIQEARKHVEVCSSHMHSVPLEAKKKYEAEVLELGQKLENMTLSKSITISQEHLLEPSLYGEENETVKYMSSAFEMRENEKYGRHIVAMEEVGKGSEVVVEKPYAAILLPKHHKTHCHTCFSKIVNSYPCSSCHDAIFCNEDCKKASVPWHQYECGILHILSSVGIAHLALRVILITRWKTYCDIREEEVEGRTAGIGESGVYNGPDMVNKYRAVYHLLPHLNRCLLEDQLQYCLAAILLATAISDRTNFIEENIDENTHKADLDVSQLASVVMRHIAQLVSNAHAITQIMPAQCESDSKVEQIQQVRVACAIYPTSSMMNHSCKPNIINSFYKDVIVIRVIENIKPGDQVNNCYGPFYCRQTRDERQDTLKQQYFFTCKCEACTQPEYMKLEAHWNGLYCESCGGVSSWMGKDDPGGGGAEDSQGILLCLQCHKLQRPSAHLVLTISKVNALYESGEEAMRKGDLPDAVSLLKRAIQIGSKVYLPENQYFLSVRDSLARALADSGKPV
ncbi:SET and MYND domain-containing protein 4 [Chionoecetes opilio]|uniref:Protein-lysine N-methyltransferase SMYD4 n=1 Tax=Chionoecetes opilio TaxID=41210 RepID=A0A8J5D0B8_CHIOP|nr:SET and MYND domain-containing protein 4 [Chionoecetes opilio]